MKLHSVSVDIQRKGFYLGHRQILVNFAVSNTISPYNDIFSDGKEILPEELLAQLKDLAKQKPELICFGGGEPLLQIDYFNTILEELPLPLYLQTNGTLPKPLAEIKQYISMVGVELIPDYEKEFLETIKLLRDNDFYVRLIVNKDTAPKQVEDYARIISSVKNVPLVLEPLFGQKSYLSLQALALRHLKEVLVIPRMHV
jgi:organic radical activating enzyme